ncbi:MAG TPA: hypothetical protein VH835_15170, partial [Dongiaceae bacterium]
GTGGKHWQSQWHTSERSDLFAKTATTLAELQRRHGGLKVCMRPQRTSSWPALEFLSAHLFRNPRHVPPAGDDVSQSLERLEIVAAAGAHDEIVEIARRIKRRLVSTGGDAPAARPGDIVVVFRSLPAAAPRVREVFASYGIPFSIEARERLLGAPVIRTLLAVLHLADEDWLFRRVVSVLTNNSLTALADAARRAAERLVRDLQIDKGRAPLLDRAEQLAQTPQALEELPEHQARRVADAREALSALRRLADALDRLPEAATHAEWCQALPRLGAELGLSPFVREAGGGAGSSSGPLNAPCGGESVESASDFVDRTAWQKIVEHFTALARLDDQLRERPGLNGDSRTQPHGPPPRLSRKEMLQLLVDVAGHESLPRRQDDVGRVRILSAATARTITAKHLFLAGMSEQAFPSPEPPGRLYREADYRTIQRNKDRQTSKRTAGVDEPPDVRRTHEEMLLFYELLTRAEETLTLSYPSLDDKAQQLPPSPYVEEIKRLLGAEKFDSRRSKPRLSPLPPDGPPWSANEWRLQATSRLLAGEPEQLGNLLGHSPTQAVAGAIAAGLRIVAARSGRQEFGWAEGLMNSPAIAARLARRF